MPDQRVDWRPLTRFRTNRQVKLGLLLIIFLVAATALSDFLSPYPPSDQDREHFFARPTRLHFVRSDGTWSLRPVVYSTRLTDRAQMRYEEDRSQSFPVRLFVRSGEYRLLGFVPCGVRLFGVDEPAKVFLLGTDGLGRDVFSRLAAGARLSLLVAGGALVLAFPLAVFIGCLSGFYGGWIDFLSMRLVEVFLALPALYLVIALRSALPLSMPAEQVSVALVALLALFGWASLARIVRGMVLSLRNREFVVAARSLGASDWRIITRHLLPQLAGFVLVQAAISAPAFMLAEVTLSYLGLGIQEPSASWGSMLASSRDIQTLVSYWWNLAPAVAILFVSLTCQILAEGFRKWADPRHQELQPAREL